MNYSNLFYDKKVGSSCAPFINNIKDLEEYFLIPIQDYMEKFNDYYKNYVFNKDNQDLIIKQKLLINEIRKEYSNKDGGDILLDESIILNIISQNCRNYGYRRFGVEIPVETISLSLFLFEYSFLISFIINFCFIIKSLLSLFII